MVEFALVASVVLLILFGIVDFGRAVYAYNTVSNAARQAARTAIVNQNISMIDATALQTAVALSITSANVSVSFEQPDRNGPCSPVEYGCLAVVTITYRYQPLTPIIGNIIGAINLSSTTAMPVENPYAS